MRSLSGEMTAHPGRRHLVWILSPIAVLIAMGYTADVLWPSLVEDNPLLLIALSARNRYLVLVVNQLSAWSYYVVGTIRLLFPDPFFFLLGWLYGAAALRWMEQRSPTIGKLLRSLEKWFERWGAPLVLLLPNNYICTIAGVARMSPWLFATLNVIGTVGRLLMIQVIGDIFAAPINSVLDFVARWRIPLLAASFALVALAVLSEIRKGKQEIAAFKEFEDTADAIERHEEPREDLKDL